MKDKDRVKNVWLSKFSAKLLKKARIKYTGEMQDAKVTDNKVIHEALERYLNDRDKRRDKEAGRATITGEEQTGAGRTEQTNNESRPT